MKPRQEPDFPATEAEVELARLRFGSEEIEIDDTAQSSRSDDGVWVQAWVWLSNDDLGWS